MTINIKALLKYNDYSKCVTIFLFVQVYRKVFNDDSNCTRVDLTCRSNKALRF